MKLYNIIIATVLFAASESAAQTNCNDLNITTCTKGAEDSCDMACGNLEDGAQVEPPCQTMCSGTNYGQTGNWDVATCTIMRRGEVIFSCTNPNLEDDEDFEEVSAGEEVVAIIATAKTADADEPEAGTTVYTAHADPPKHGPWEKTRGKRLVPRTPHPVTCNSLQITTCDKGAENSCDEACGTIITPGCQTMCHGTSGGDGVLSCSITKQGQEVFKCVNPSEDEDVEEADKAERVDISKSFISFLRGIV